MLSQIPVDFTKVKKENLNKEILRAAIIAELDAINLYEQMAALTDDPDIQKVLYDIAREEKTHVGEFETMLSEPLRNRYGLNFRVSDPPFIIGELFHRRARDLHEFICFQAGSADQRA